MGRGGGRGRERRGELISEGIQAIIALGFSGRGGRGAVHVGGIRVFTKGG
jgi:hypothetical protein